MRKILFLIMIAPFFLTAQVMNTARVLNQKQAAIQVYPSFQGENPYIYLAGEYGLKNAMDLQINFGAGETPYFGTNIEKVVAHNDLIIAAIGGIHYAEDLGLNLAGNLTYPLAGNLDIYTGLDINLNMAESIKAPVWIFLGNAINYKSNLQFFLEVAVGIEAENIISLGINYNLGKL